MPQPVDVGIGGNGSALLAANRVKNNITIKIGKDTVFSNIDGDEARAGHIVIDGHLCNLLVAKHSLIFETEAELDIQISGDAPLVTNLNVHTKGKCTLALKSTTDALNLSIYAKNIDIDTAINTKGYVILYTHVNKTNFTEAAAPRTGRVIFRQPSRIDLCVIYAQEFLIAENLFFKHFFCYTKKLVQHARSSFEIVTKENDSYTLDEIREFPEIIAARLAEFNKNRHSLLVIDQLSLYGSSVFKSCTVVADSFNVNGMQFFCFSNITANTTLVKKDNKLFLYDTTATTNTFTVDGGLSQVGSDIIVTKEGILSATSDTNLHSSNIIAGNLHMYGSMQIGELTHTNTEELIKYTHTQIERIKFPSNLVIVRNIDRAYAASHNQLREIFREISVPMFDYNKRAIYVDNTNGFTHKTVVLGLLYAGLIAGEQTKIINLLRALHNMHMDGSKTTGQSRSADSKQFAKFIGNYLHANHCFAIKDFLQKCLANNSKYSKLIDDIAKCMQAHMHKISVHGRKAPTVDSAQLTQHRLDPYVDIQQLKEYCAHLKINFKVQSIDDKGQLKDAHNYSDAENKLSVAFYEVSENARNLYLLAVDLDQLYSLNLINPVPHADKINYKLEREIAEKAKRKEERKKKRAESAAAGQSVANDEDDDSDDDEDTKQEDKSTDQQSQTTAEQEAAKKAAAENELIKPQKLLEAIAVFCYYTNESFINRFDAEYQNKIRSMIRILFADEAENATEPGNAVIHNGAHIRGDFHGIYADGAVFIKGKISVNRANLYAKSVTVSKEGSLHARDKLLALVGGVTRVYGSLGSDKEATLFIDHLFPAKYGAVYGKEKLLLNAITTVSSLGKLYGSNISGSSFIYLNFGVASAWNNSLETFVGFPGVNLPYKPPPLPKFSDLPDPNKLITLAKMSVGVFSLPLAAGVTVLFKGVAFYNSLPKFEKLYKYLISRSESIQDLTLDETCQAILCAKRAINESVSLYTAIPSPTAAYESLSTSLTTNSIPEPTDLYRTPTQVYTDGTNLFTEAFATEKASYNLWTNPALRSVVDGAVDVGSVFMPHVHVDSAISLGGSFGISGTMSSQSIWQLQPFGATVCLNQSDQAVYKYTNSLVVNAAYNSNTNCLLRYADNGQTFAINWSVRTPVYELRGYLTSIRRSLQVRSGYIREGAHFLGTDGFDIKAHDFTIAGTANLPNGSMQVTGKFKTDSTAAITTHNAVIFAEEQDFNQRLWEASGVLHIQVGHGASSPESDLNILPGASYSFRAKTADLQGSEHYDSPHIQVDEMSAQEALDWSRSQAKHANKEFRTGGLVATESTEHLDLQYIGPRDDGLPVVLQTRGTFSLPPNYDRARDKRFTSYAEALHFAQYVYPTYNLPPPRLPRRRWYERLPRVLSEFFGVSSAAMAAGVTPVTAAASATLAVAAYGFDRISAHTQRRENRVLENHALRLADANRAADAAALDNARLADLQDAAMNRHFDTVASITNGRHISSQDSIRRVTSTTAAIEDRYTRAQQDLTQRHAQTAYEIRTVHDRQRRQITYSTTSPRVGIGLSTNMGPTGITSALTFSSGIRGQTGTGSLTLHNHDFARVQIRGNTQQPQLPLLDQHVPNTPIPPLTTSQTVSESQSSRFAIIEETDGGFIINPTNTRHTEVRSTSQETVTTLSTNREASAPTADYESVTAEQWQRNYGCKLTKANVFRLYVTKRLLPGDRNYVARVIGGAIVQSVTEGEDATFGRVRRTKDAIVGYFQKGLDVYEREAARLGIKPNITHQTYAAPGLASAALVLVPENADQVITEIAVMLGLHVVGVGVARSTTWMYNRARNTGAVARRLHNYSDNVISEKTLMLSRKSQIDFVPTGFLDGHFYPQEKLPKLYEYLRKRGADIQPMPLGAKGPGFRACDPRTGKPTLYLPDKPTVLELKHELSHYLDFRSMGIEKYSSLTRLEKEQLVLDRLRENRIWEQVLNTSERAFSETYVAKLRFENSLTTKPGGPNFE